MWGRSEEDHVFHLVTHFRSKRYQCGLPVRRHIATADARPRFGTICDRCEQIVQEETDPLRPKPLAEIAPLPAAPPEASQEAVVASLAETGTALQPLATGRALVHPGTVEEPEYFQFVMDQIAAENKGTEDRLAALRRSLHANDFVEEATRAWQIALCRDRRGVLKSLQSRPYFGQFDFLEDGAAEKDVVYVGSGSVHENGINFVHDWRADICSLFYGQSVGEAAYASPGGVRTGSIDLHRTYRIEDRQLKGYHDLEGGESGSHAADEMLVELLSRHTIGSMRQIVQSIQAEQDKIIRNRAGVLIVEGPAGSGKTIIALHRAAYLLYHLRAARPNDEVTSRRMIAFSPNRTFATYIASVLPDLNEGQIRQIILHQLLVEQLAKLVSKARGRAAFRIESNSQQFEAALGSLNSPVFAARRQCCLFKASRAMMDLIEEFVAKREQEIEERFTDLEYPPTGGDRSLFFTHAEMLMLFRQSGRHGESMAARSKSVIKSVAARISEAARQPTTASRTIESLRTQLARIERELSPLLGMNGLDAYTAIWSEREPLAAALSSSAAQISADQIAEETLACLQDRRIAAEDVAPILLLDGLLNGFHRLENTDHVVVDEAQDYTLLHFEYLKRCLPESCTWTIVGDMRQATNPLLSLEVYSTIDTVFTRSLEHLQLTKSYRSSYEINEFTGRILPGDALPEGIRRTTVKPTLVPANDPAATIAKILRSQQNEGSTAIICRTTADSVKLYAVLKSKATITLVTDETNDLPTGAYILPVRLAKGLEFDTVILHDAGAAVYCHDSERRILYTACSRALHRLYLVHAGDPSPLLPLGEPELFAILAFADLE